MAYYTTHLYNKCMHACAKQHCMLDCVIFHGAHGYVLGMLSPWPYQGSRAAVTLKGLKQAVEAGDMSARGYQYTVWYRACTSWLC